MHHHGPYKFKEFLPLIILGLIILTLTGFSVYISENSSAVFATQMFMGFFFIVFGSFKAAQPKGFADAFAEYDILAGKSRVYALAYPFIELLLGTLYLWSIALVAVNTLTALLMGFGALGVYKKLREGEEVPCACLGVVFKIPMTYVTLGEDLLMFAMALFMLSRMLF